MLKYTAGHINYGGRVTDDWDRRCLMNVLNSYYNQDVLGNEHLYSASGIYKQIDADNDYAVSIGADVWSGGHFGTNQSLSQNICKKEKKNVPVGESCKFPAFKKNAICSNF